ncbi:MAG: hypothetical protein ACQEWM_12740 [Actinomycetota bacterium]
MSPAAMDAVARLRAGLHSGDTAAVALGLQQVPVAIAVDAGQPRVAADGDLRVLPVFLDMESWRAFGLPGDPQLLTPEALRPLLEALPHIDDIVIDPALPSAIRVPRTDVVQLLGGKDAADETDASDETAGFDPDVQLAVSARTALLAAGHAGMHSAWAVQRVTAAGTTPAIAVADTVEDVVLGAIADALANAGLPLELELVQLDEAWTRTARDEWAEVAVA